MDVGSLGPALAEMRKAAELREARRGHAGRLKPAQLNTLLYRSERAALDLAGLPGRPWYRRQFYAPGFYTGYDAKTLPGVREAVELKAVRGPPRARGGEESFWGSNPGDHSCSADVG